MDNGSTEWNDGLLEVTLAMNTQKHPTIGCAPAELLFRERTSYIDRLNSQKRKDMTIRVTQEDPNLAPIHALGPTPPSQAGSSRIDIGIRPGQNSQITMRISPEAGSEINLRITPQMRSSPVQEWFDMDAYEPGIEPESEAEPEPESEPEPTIIVAQLGDPIIGRAQESTVKARVQMAEKYSKRHDIQHFEIGDVVSLKVLREHSTSTNDRHLFGRIINEPYPHRYKVGCNTIRES
jgi:hypothetical protein